MPGSRSSVFGEPDEFRAALSPGGALNLLVAGRGCFRARLTQLSLHRLRLAAGEEELPRIAFVVAPPGKVLVSLAIGSGPWPLWGGSATQAGEILTLAAGQPIHTRTIGPCRWGAMLVSEQDLVQYGRALSGACLEIPPGVARL